MTPHPVEAATFHEYLSSAFVTFSSQPHTGFLTWYSELIHVRTFFDHECHGLLIPGLVPVISFAC